MARPRDPAARRQRWRRRLGTTLAVIAFLAVSFATLWFGYTAPVTWQVASVGADGHSLNIQVAGNFGSCTHTPFVVVSSADDDLITLRVRKRLDLYCAHNHDVLLLAYAPFHVDVGRPVRGQEIRGAAKSDRTLPRFEGHRRLRMPRVVGLAPDDARSVIRRPSLGDTPVPSDAHVVRQDPMPGAPTDADGPRRRTAHTARTVPRPVRLTWSDGTTTTSTSDELRPLR